jgi:hypothetical protein
MAFGPVGRAWQPRAQLAGTYDQKWLSHTFPFLPTDFSEEYYQSAPADQQIDYPSGNEQVELHNLTSGGRLHFPLPSLELPIEIQWRKRPTDATFGVVDTIMFEPDLKRLTLVWRCTVQLARNIFEVTKAIVGRMPSAWYRARRRGKTYYRNLQELAANRSW